MSKKQTPSPGWPEAFAAVALTGLVLGGVTAARTSDRIRDGEFRGPDVKEEAPARILPSKYREDLGDIFTAYAANPLAFTTNGQPRAK